MLLSPNQFTTLLNEWFRYKSGRSIPSLKNLGFLKGGWEGWTQADFAAWVFNKNDAYNILREAHIYTNKAQAADWVVNVTEVQPKLVLAGDANDVIVVELKCESLGQADVNGADNSPFKERIKKDLGKLNSLVGRGYNLLMVVIFFSPEMNSFLMQNDFNIIAGTTDVACAIKWVEKNY